MCDQEIADRLLAHPSTTRRARELLLAAGKIKAVGFKDMGGPKAHMTYSPVLKGQRSAQIAALRKHILDGLQRISCFKRTISAERRVLRDLEMADVQAQRKRACTV
jgi:hypothetical protein